jgi:hypothetical protein
MRVTPRLLLWTAGTLVAAGLLARCNGDSSCAELAQRARTARDQAVRKAGLACTQDADCSLDGYGLTCVDDCDARFLLARDDVPAVESATQMANDRYCQPFDSQGCEVLLLPCAPPGAGGTPVCRNGQCSLDATNIP